MRQCNLRRVPAEKHHKFKSLALTVQYLITMQPRVALLENTLGFDRPIINLGGSAGAGAAHSRPDGQQPPTGDAVAQRGLQWLQNELQDYYHVDAATLDLRSWCKCRRPRLWIFLVHKDTGSRDAARRACQLAMAIQKDRSQHPAATIDDYTWKPGSAEWLEHVLPSKAHGSATASADRAYSQKGHKDSACLPPNWQEQVQRRRQAWKQAGHAWHAHHPLATAALSGLSGTARERETLEVFLLEACRQQNLSPLDAQRLEQVKVGLTADISQNPAWLRPSGDGSAAAYCTGSRVYSFSQDRLLHPIELLGTLGWRSRATPPPCCAGLTSTQVQNLVGESQALPCLAAATWGLLLAVWGDAATAQRLQQRQEGGERAELC